MCYTYDNLSRVTARTVKKLSDNSVVSTETFNYDAAGNITDTLAYDTYGKLINRTGTSEIIFGYNGRDGVVTDDNGLIYMRARYYSPEMKRFVNADIIPGKLSNAVTLNRFAYANGNPVSFVDPFGLIAEKETENNSSTELSPTICEQKLTV
jgi:RHS repeat-associated protein